MTIPRRLLVIVAVIVALAVLSLAGQNLIEVGIERVLHAFAYLWAAVIP